jgi:hypothetical protein
MPVKKKVMKKAKKAPKKTNKKVVKKTRKGSIGERMFGPKKRKPVKKTVKRRVQPKPRRARPKLPSSRDPFVPLPPQQKLNGKVAAPVVIEVPVAPPQATEELIEPTDLEAVAKDELLEEDDGLTDIDDDDGIDGLT